VEGVLDAKADHKTGKAVIQFDHSRASKSDIVDAINATSYKVAGQINK